MKFIEGGTLNSRPQLTQAKLSSPAPHLRELIEIAIEHSTADGILLSGGLDTSILSAAAAKQGRRLWAVCVSVEGIVSPDEPFAKMMADRCGFTLCILRPSLDNLAAIMPEVMRVLSTFDPME